MLDRMTLTRIHPDGLHATPTYHHVTVSEAGRTAHLAGQCPLDAAGELVGADDVVAQTGQVVTNALTALRAAGAAPGDVARSVVYVASTDPADLVAVWDRLVASELGEAFTTASTLLGVTCLGYPGQLVEVDLTAAL